VLGPDVWLHLRERGGALFHSYARHLEVRSLLKWVPVGSIEAIPSLLTGLVDLFEEVNSTGEHLYCDGFWEPPIETMNYRDPGWPEDFPLVGTILWQQIHRLSVT
jgi:hypothetical protein